MKNIKLLTDRDVKSIVDKRTDINMSFLNVELESIKADLLHISANLDILEARVKKLEVMEKR